MYPEKCRHDKRIMNRYPISMGAGDNINHGEKGNQKGGQDNAWQADISILALPADEK